MIVRLLFILSLLLSTLPAAARAAPPCHEMADQPRTLMTHPMGDPPAAPTPDEPQKMRGSLCIGCIAPATLRTGVLNGPFVPLTRHAPPPKMEGARLAGWKPEPPPPRA